jgi:hypothetical protein
MCSPQSAVRPVFNGQGWVTPMHQDGFVLTGCEVAGQLPFMYETHLPTVVLVF